MIAESDKLVSDKLAEAFKQVGKSIVNKMLKTYLKDAAKGLLGDVKRFTPEDTKELQKLIKARVGKRSTIAANYQVGVNSTDFKKFTPKASIQEYGNKTNKMKDNSYLRRAFDNDAEKIAAKLQKDILKDIEDGLKQ